MTSSIHTGVQLHHESHGDPQGPPVVMLHGFTDSSWSYSRILPLLPQSYALHAVDLRGHGRSDKPRGDYDIDTLAADVLAFLDRIGAAHTTLVGHSLGTIVARRVAQQRPERVAGLVLIGPIVTPVNDGLREFAGEVAGLSDPVPVEFIHEFQASTLHVPVPSEFYARVMQESQLLPAHVWHGGADGLMAADDAAALSRITAPTWLLWGDQDAIVPRDDLDRVAAGIQGARVVTYTDTGHAPHWERPETVAADIAEFLAHVHP